MACAVVPAGPTSVLRTRQEACGKKSRFLITSRTRVQERNPRFHRRYGRGRRFVLGAPVGSAACNALHPDIEAPLALRVASSAPHQNSNSQICHPAARLPITIVPNRRC
jgi:hypothetical protein